MIRTQEATGKTVDEARTNACALLGVEKPHKCAEVPILGVVAACVKMGRAIRVAP